MSRPRSQPTNGESRSGLSFGSCPLSISSPFSADVCRVVQYNNIVLLNLWDDMSENELLFIDEGPSMGAPTVHSVWSWTAQGKSEWWI